MSTAARYLIVNADDFGFAEGINRGIVEAHERGVVTSTSLMSRRLVLANIRRRFFKSAVWSTRKRKLVMLMLE